MEKVRFLHDLSQKRRKIYKVIIIKEKNVSDIISQISI